ncbi:MAG TPA: CoA ester lyase [Chloroflexota bacterium]|jgi:citrate lyase subunit beta/citryl-CoA lyase|nr:CoA ester lyase [Chloroflexota bacterium]
MSIRSKLFVPGSRPELFDKALASEADAISIDLEDAVQESRKAEARRAARDFLTAASAGKYVIVRVNGRRTVHFEADVEAVAVERLDCVNLPKTESPEDVRALAERIPTSIAIMPTIESPQGLRRAAEIAAADARVVGLQLGLGDLFGPLGIDRRDAAAVHAVQLAMRLAAGEAGVSALDSAFTDVADTSRFQREAEQACRLGYTGKSCIHPSQVPVANAVFRPGDEEIAHSLRVVEAWRAATQEGVGALLVDGKMIDLPFARRAEMVVEQARRLGLI